MSTFEDSSLSDKASVVSLEKCRFGYRVSMERQWVANSAKFLDYLEGRFSQSVNALIEAREILGAEVYLTILLKFNMKAEMKVYIDSLKFQ